MKCTFQGGLLLLVNVLFSSAILAQAKYTYEVDLTKVTSDKLRVSLLTPPITTDSVVFHLPKIVPGTYAIHNYGSFASQFKAFDKKGAALNVIQRDKNSWVIKSAKQLSKIEYLVDDSWDTPAIEEDIFEPAGTNIQADTLFMLNSFGFFGYIQGKEELPFVLRIRRPEGFYASTSLEADKRHNDATLDVFSTANYNALADAPIMYSKPDTAWLQLGNTKVLISVFSPNKKASAATIAKDIDPILEAQRKYLGGQLPVSKYAFLIYLSNRPDLTRYGALEHSQSSVYYLPERFSPEELSKTVKDVAAHEFFHVVTPLNIHSEEIGKFDYMEPKMSKHLWLYEGLTEYAAHHAQVIGGIIDFNTYLDRQAEKINIAHNNFNDTLPFTELSSKTLGIYKEEYQNVYYKGALIGLCLDIKLQQLSGGKYNTRKLMQDLARTYGKDRSFKDDELFDKITSLTYPEIRDFFRRYVEGSEPLPLKEVFNSVGAVYNPADTVYTLEIAFNTGYGLVKSTKEIYITDVSGVTALGKRLGFQRGDTTVSFNGKPFNVETYGGLFDDYQSTAKKGDTVTWVVRRKKADGVGAGEVTLSTVLQEEPAIKATVKANPNATAEQIALRNKWISLD
jgi:predicted metalloprotease with PDZ domain